MVHHRAAAFHDFKLSAEYPFTSPMKVRSSSHVMKFVLDSSTLLRIFTHASFAHLHRLHDLSLVLHGGHSNVCFVSLFAPGDQVTHVREEFIPSQESRRRVCRVNITWAFTFGITSYVFAHFLTNASQLVLHHGTCCIFLSSTCPRRCAESSNSLETKGGDQQTKKQHLWSKLHCQV